MENKEIEKKRIEEMTKTLCDYCFHYDDCITGSEEMLAKHLVKQGYTKIDYKNIDDIDLMIFGGKRFEYIPEDSFVLTNDNAGELANLIVTSPQMQSVMSDLINAWQKEIAEKIYWALRKECFSPSRGYYESDGFSAIDLILRDIIAKEFGVEIKE